MNTKKYRRKGFAAIELLVIVVLVGVLGYAGWSAWHQSRSVQRASSTSSPVQSTLSTPTTSPKVVSQSATYNKYVNPSTGISIIYSKMVANTASCKGTAPNIEPTVVSVPVNVYENQADHMLYVAASRHAVTISHQIGPGTYQGFDSCVVQDTSVYDIEHPASKISGNDWMLAVKLEYGKINSPGDLDAFVTTQCSRGHRY